LHVAAIEMDGGAERPVGEHYFDWHHTNADTLDKVDPQDFRKAVAMLGVVGYVLADMPETVRGMAGITAKSTQEKGR
jgi:hypothetical protein